MSNQELGIGANVCSGRTVVAMLTATPKATASVLIAVELGTANVDY